MHENQLVASFPATKVWLTTLLAVVCTFVFNLLDLFGIETTVAQEQVMQLGAALLSPAEHPGRCD